MPKCLEMTPDEQKVLGVLWAHDIEPFEGCGEYVPVKTIAKIAGLHPRKVQHVVNCLVNNHEALIGHSCSAKDPGNKLLTSGEVQDELDKLDRRARKVFWRKSRINRTSIEQEIKRFAQGELWKGEAA